MQAKIRIVGHRRSGTNYIEHLFKRNLTAQIVKKGKYLMPDNEIDCPTYQVIRNPYDLMSSLYDWGKRHWFHKPEFAGYIQSRRKWNLDEFIIAPLASGDGALKNETPLEYYIRFIMAWQRYTPLLVRYEDAVLHPQKILNSVFARRVGEFVPVDECVSPRGSRNPEFNLFNTKMLLKQSTVRYVTRVVEPVRHLWPEVFE
jgi:hypothetical protein